ncbi:hypothetical protein PFISCL1PPCAC_1676, partial [Pristionchus fissidentatus]
DYLCGSITFDDHNPSKCKGHLMLKSPNDEKAKNITEGRCNLQEGNWMYVDGDTRGSLVAEDNVYCKYDECDYGKVFRTGNQCE